MPNRTAIDKPGDKRGTLTFVTEIERNAKGNRQYIVMCDCSEFYTIERNRWITDRTCKACQYAKLASDRAIYGGEIVRETSLYKRWQSMKQRCYNEKSDAYPWYGAKGIRLCDEWLDFGAFRTWARSTGYVYGLTIDRIDSTGNYQPSNCEWVTRSENTKRVRRSENVKRTMARHHTPIEMFY